MNSEQDEISALKFDHPVHRADLRETKLFDMAAVSDRPWRHAAVRIGEDGFSTTTSGSNGRVFAKTTKRVIAVPPTQTAPKEAKTSRQASEGTPILDTANTT